MPPRARGAWLATAAAACAALVLTSGARGDDACAAAKAHEDTEQTSAFFFAAQSGSLDAIKALIAADDCGAQSRSADGRGPLFWAYEHGYRPIVDALLEAGADAAATDDTGATAESMLPVDGWRELPPQPERHMYDGLEGDHYDDDDFFDYDTDEDESTFKTEL